MAGNSITQLVGSISDLLGQISRIHDLEIDSLRKENSSLSTELNSARTKAAESNPASHGKAPQGDSSDGNPLPSAPAVKPCTETILDSSNSNSRRTSRSSRRTSNVSSCLTPQWPETPQQEKHQLEQHHQHQHTRPAVKGRVATLEDFPKFRRSKTAKSLSALELRKVHMAARMRVPRESGGDAVLQEPILPNLLSSNKIGASSMDSEDPPSSVSSEDEAVSPKTLPDVAEPKENSTEKPVSTSEKQEVTFHSQDHGNCLKDQAAADGFNDNDSVELCAVWKSRKRSLGRIARRALTPLTSVETVELQSSVEDDWQVKPTPPRLRQRLVRAVHNFWQQVVARPSSKRRLLWDFMGMMLIGYDLIVIPLSAFDPPTNVFTEMMAWACTLYWTLDIPCTLVVGYHSKGVLEMRPLRIVAHYLRTWLVFDVGVVAVDWMCTVAENMSSSGGNRVGYLRFGRFGRFLRMLRLLRLLKLHGMLVDIFERINSEFARIVLGIVNVLIFIVLVNHVIACGWYWVGTQCFQAGLPSWVLAAELSDRTLAYNYTTSAHWSLTQFTPASMEVVAQNTVERTYTACTLLFAMCTFSSFVSGITNAMTRLRNLNSDSVIKATVLRQFLKENRISGEVCNRIWAWLHYAEESSRRRIHEDQVAILPTLPALLQTEVHHAIYKPLLDKHPWFSKFACTHPDGMRGLYTCLVEVGLAIGKELFHCGQLADRMFFIFTGHLRYLRDDELKSSQSWQMTRFEDVVVRYAPHSDHSQEKQAAIVGPGHWASEHPLWIQWHHVGQLMGLSHCELFAIKAQKFQELMHGELHGVWQAVKYAKAFYNFLNCSQVALTDIWFDHQSLDDMATCAFTLTEDDVMSSSSGESGTTCSPFSSRRQSRSSASERLSRQSTHSHSWNSRMSQGFVRRSFGTPSQTFSSPVPHS